MILCKHGLTEIIMIYCVANQPKNAIFAEKWEKKCPKWEQKAFIWGGKPPIWHIYFNYYGYFKEIGH